MDDYSVGEYIIYRNGDRYELGRIKSLQEDGAFVAYHEGETSAKTPWDCMHKLINAYCIKDTTLGGECFKHGQYEINDEELIRRSDAIKVAKEFWYKPDIAGALAELPTVEPKAKVVAQITFNEEKLREIVKKAVERFKEEYEIEPKRGEWVEDICKYDRAYHFKCSVCGEWNGLSVDEWNWKPNFCPHCGADMRGGKE